jgi:hypothetical protein
MNLEKKNNTDPLLKSSYNNNKNKNKDKEPNTEEFNIVVSAPSEDADNDEFVLEDAEWDEKNTNKKKSTTVNKNIKDNENDMDFNNQIKKREELEKVKIRRTQANNFEKYVNETGIGNAFQLIFTELITKKISMEDYFSYSAGRLRQIGREVDEVKLTNKNVI